MRGADRRMPGRRRAHRRDRHPEPPASGLLGHGEAAGSAGTLREVRQAHAFHRKHLRFRRSDAAAHRGPERFPGARVAHDARRRGPSGKRPHHHDRYFV